VNIWVLALALAAGLGLVAEEAFADRSRHNSSSAHQHRQHQPRAQHQHRERPHHLHPHRYHHHHHVRPRIAIVPAFPGYYYAPAPVIVAPPVLPSMDSGYWYFCPDSRAYYPYVLECPSGWLAVVPGTAP